ncbi:MAG: aromatic ring-hydroxylating dioxygenase subunit alpha [Alphaproteobacteria bacterium]|nr:aromatic ring-hydroxylating dioxygenase subunit alpha [Alphaproteobacteria bacterium]
MIRDQWYAIEEARRVRGAPVGLRRLGKPLVLWRDAAGTVRCAYDACPHRGAALSRGRMHQGALECPYHGLRFDGSGACTHVPCHPDRDDKPRFDLHLLPVREERGLVWLWNGEDDGALPGIPWDDAIQARLDATGSPQLDLTDTFDVSYLRVMENLTDYHHVPFVHRWTVPAPAEVTRFHAERHGVDIVTEGALGDRLTARTHIRGPCFAVIEFGGLACFTVAATPVDDGHTWLFARYTQQWLRIPGLSWLATWVLGQFDYRLLQRLQDAPVWRSQRLADPADIRRYALLPADEGVRLYFEMHAELACR